MSRSSTADLGALLPGQAPLAKPKVPVYHLQLNISWSCPCYKEDDQDKSKAKGKSSTTGTHQRTLVLFSLRRTIGRNKEDGWEEQGRRAGGVWRQGDYQQVLIGASVSSAKGRSSTTHSDQHTLVSFLLRGGPSGGTGRVGEFGAKKLSARSVSRQRLSVWRQ